MIFLLCKYWKQRITCDAMKIVSLCYSLLTIFKYEYNYDPFKSS